MAWLREPKSTFGHRTPLQLRATKSGAFAVEELMVGIEHGMFVQGNFAYLNPCPADGICPRQPR